MRDNSSSGAASFHNRGPSLIKHVIFVGPDRQIFEKNLEQNTSFYCRALSTFCILFNLIYYTPLYLPPLRTTQRFCPNPTTDPSPNREGGPFPRGCTNALLRGSLVFQPRTDLSVRSSILRYIVERTESARNHWISASVW